MKMEKRGTYIIGPERARVKAHSAVTQHTGEVNALLSGAQAAHSFTGSTNR